jgi:hypothetical protein
MELFGHEHNQRAGQNKVGEIRDAHLDGEKDSC